MQITRRHTRRRWTAKATPAPRVPIPCHEIQSAVLGANQVHDALCAPPSLHIGNMEVASSIVPARYVSGDFVLSFEQDGSHYVVLGDLMGKGLSAAMWLTHVVDLIRRACEQEDNLPGIMGRLNREMYRSRVGVPLTSLFLARIERCDSRVTYSCGGCPAAFLLGADLNVRLLDAGGPLVGAVEQASYGAETIQLAPLQVMLAVSDGITEIHHDAHFDLRPDHVIRHLQYTAGESAQSIVQSLTAKVRNRTESLTDDLSVVAIQRVS